MKHLLLVPLYLCTHALMAQDYPSPVLPIGADQIDQGVVIGNYYNVTDKAGRDYSGVTVGDRDFNLTVPFGQGDTVLQSGGIIINLGQ